jgi:lipopolysaccharide export system protein LptA
MRTLLFVLLLFAGCSPVLAQGPVEVTADDFVVDQGKALATFSGNVVVFRSDLMVWADQVVVEYADSNLSTIRVMIATGNVRLKTETQDATGDRAVFDPATQILRLTGNVTVINASGTVNGPELLVNLEDDTTTFTSSGGERVTGVFTPNE